MTSPDLPRIRLLLVEDDAFTRAGLKAVLSTTPDLHLVATAESGEEALELVCQHEIDLVVIDLYLPGIDGIQTAVECQQRCPRVKVMMLTGMNRAGQVFAALASGAVAYCLKSAPVDVMLQAIRAAAAGNVFLDAQSAQHVLRTVHSDAPVTPLTERELSVLRLIAEGQSNQEIAQQLKLGVATVKQVIQSILDKLQAQDRTQAAVKALRAGLL